MLRTEQGEPEHDASGGYRASYIITSMSEEILLFELLHFIMDHFKHRHKDPNSHSARGSHPHTEHPESLVDYYVDHSWFNKRGSTPLIRWRQEVAVSLLLLFYFSEIATEVARLRTGTALTGRGGMWVSLVHPPAFPAEWGLNSCQCPLPEVHLHLHLPHPHACPVRVVSGSHFLFDYGLTDVLIVGIFQLTVCVVCFVVGFLLQSQFLGQGIVGFGSHHRIQLTLLVIAYSFLLIMDQLYAGQAGASYIIQVGAADDAASAAHTHECRTSSPDATPPPPTSHPTPNPILSRNRPPKLPIPPHGPVGYALFWLRKPGLPVDGRPRAPRVPSGRLPRRVPDRGHHVPHPGRQRALGRHRHRDALPARACQ